MVGGGALLLIAVRVFFRGADLMPDGGGWGSVADAAIKGAILAGVFGGLGAALAFLGVFLYNRGRKITAKRAQSVLSDSSAQTVLYLRSFADDAIAATTPDLKTNFFTIPAFATQEEQTVAVLALAGAVVGVGRPGERLPELGAARL